MVAMSLGGRELANGSTVLFQYDESGQFTTEIDPMGAKTHYAYDEAGQLTQITDEAGNVLETRAYDPAGRLTRRTDALGDATTFTYTPDGRIKTLTNTLGQTWSYTHTSTTTTVTDPLGRTTTTQVNPYGLPIQTVLADGSTSQVQYLLHTVLEDGDEYPTSITDPGGRTRSYTYTPVGQLATATTLAGETTPTIPTIRTNYVSFKTP